MIYKKRVKFKDSVFIPLEFINFFLLHLYCMLLIELGYFLDCNNNNKVKKGFNVDAVRDDAVNIQF